MKGTDAGANKPLLDKDDKIYLFLSTLYKVEIKL